MVSKTKKPIIAGDYELFKKKVYGKLRSYKNGLTWTEIREKTGLPQKVPYNAWTKRLEKEINLQRVKDARGVVWLIR